MKYKNTQTNRYGSPKNPPKKVRTYKKGEWVLSLQVIDNHGDRVFTIPKDEWNRYKSAGHYTVLGEVLVHRVVTVLALR